MQLDNPRHEAFCQHVAKGFKGAEAYREVYGKDRKNARGGASDLIRDNPDISARIKELSARSAEGAVMTLREEMEFLTRAILTPIDQIDETHVLCQRVKRTDAGTEFWSVDKLRAMELLARLKKELSDKPLNVAVGVNVNVTVMSEERQNELQDRKAEALRRRGVTSGKN